jgi:hypothetical protein
VLEEFLDRVDPVRKAERTLKRTTKPMMETAENAAGKHSVQTKLSAKVRKKRTPIAACARHIVNARDQARCTFIDLAGNRCTNDHWLHLHHILPVSRGGGNEPENISTLCSFHHDLVHQLGFPIEGQMNWIREPARAYCH